MYELSKSKDIDGTDILREEKGCVVIGQTLKYSSYK
jgi:hypothetical protein